MDRLDQYLGVHGTALKLRGERLNLLASNIANAATPGYKARDIEFTNLLVDRPRDGTLAVTNRRHLPEASERAEPTLRYRVPVQASLDGNTVELATEQIAFADNAVRYRSTLAMLNGRLATLNSALKGE